MRPIECRGLASSSEARMDLKGEIKCLDRERAGRHMV